MPKLDEFVAPTPWPAFASAMSWVNRVLMLHGIPLMRDVPFIKNVPGIRGLTGIRHIVTDANHLRRLDGIIKRQVPVFILPNHPEFFTDWMLDKEIIARAAPEAASWATHSVVNGMGGAMQKFWLWNNLIAQIPGKSEASKAHSVAWALRGKGVLLHPEGMVGWHPDWIAPLMPGAADMARDCANKTGQSSFLQPVVWKIVFNGDVSRSLSKEVAYVEKRLGLVPRPELTPAKRVHAIYLQLADRELSALDLHVVENMPLVEKMRTIETVLSLNLANWIGNDALINDIPSLISLARKKAREMKQEGSDGSQGTEIADRLQKHRRLGRFAFEKPEVSQEEVAAHIKRLRNDWCKGTLRDSVNAFLPQPAGLRTAHVRFLDLIPVSPGTGSSEIMEMIRQGMQTCLDDLNDQLKSQTGRFSEPNPFIAS